MSPAAQSEPNQEPLRRLVFCITGLAPGGAERALVEVAVRLRDRYEVEVVSLQGPPLPERSQLVDRLQAAQVPVAFLNARSVFQTPWIASALSHRFRTFRPQLVQGFLFHANLLAAWSAWAARVPCCVAGMRVVERRGAWRGRLERFFDRWVDAYACVSEPVALHLRGVGLRPEKLHVLPNGLDTARFHAPQPRPPELADLPAGAVVCLFLGRLDPQKGIDWLWPWMEAQLSRRPELWFAAVGDGPSGEWLRSAVSRSSLRQRVKLVGWRPDPAPWLQAADVVLFPSRWEGMANALAEALAAGKPVLAHAVEGVSELLSASESGEASSSSAPAQQLLPALETSLWDAAAAPLFDSAELRSSLGAANRRRMELRPDWDQAAAAYADLYERLWAEKGDR